MEPSTGIALALVRDGFATLPVRASKVPATPHGHLDATADPGAVARLFAAYPAPLIGIATGVPSGVAVLDVDPPGLPWLEANARRLPETIRVRTRRGGFHFWFRIGSATPRSTASEIAPGVDTRGAGGYCIAWEPSLLIGARLHMAV
jgi:hypothetical protein